MNTESLLLAFITFAFFAVSIALAAKFIVEAVIDYLAFKEDVNFINELKEEGQDDDDITG